METIVYTVAFHGGTEVKALAFCRSSVCELLGNRETGLWHASTDMLLELYEGERKTGTVNLDWCMMPDELKYDSVKFTVFCIEAYRAAKGLSGREVTDLFDRHGVLDFIEECGDVLHCQGEANTIADIDDYIANHREAVRGK